MMSPYKQDNAELKQDMRKGAEEEARQAKQKIEEEKAASRDTLNQRLESKRKKQQLPPLGPQQSDLSRQSSLAGSSVRRCRLTSG